MNLFNLRRQSPSFDELAIEPLSQTMNNDVSRDCLMPSVERPAQIFVRGQGSWMWDSESRAYLDFT